MDNDREVGPEEQALTVKLYNLLDPPVAGMRFQNGGDKVLIYASIPMEGLPGAIIGCCAHWLYHALGGSGNLGLLSVLLSRALGHWVTERSKKVPIVA